MSLLYCIFVSRWLARYQKAFPFPRFIYIPFTVILFVDFLVFAIFRSFVSGRLRSVYEFICVCLGECMCVCFFTYKYLAFFWSLAAFFLCFFFCFQRRVFLSFIFYHQKYMCMFYSLIYVVRCNARFAYQKTVCFSHHHVVFDCNISWTER